MKSLTQTAAVLLVLISFTMTAKTDETETATAQIEVIAHRGASAVAPENTLAAFKLASEQGADWIEMDCCQCKSGELVIIHDATVNRTTDGKGKVADLTLEELRKLDAGSWKDKKYAGEKIPTLKESLAVGGTEVAFYVEVKAAGKDTAAEATLKRLGANLLKRTPEFDAAFIKAFEASANLKLARAVISEITQAKMEKRVVLQSFSTVICAVAAIEAPELKVELLGGGTSANNWEQYYRWTLLFDLDGINASAKSLNEGRLGVLQAAGVSCGVYTVDNVKEMQRFASLGVKRMITNKPDLCISELKKLGKHE